MSEREQALDKIKKLLRMKRGGTQAEIETALNLAREIAAKFGIDLQSVNPEEEEQQRPIGHEDTIHTARLQWECKYAALICKRFFNVSAFTNHKLYGWRWKHFITFVGTDWDRQIATCVWCFLVGHFRREWNTKRGRCRNRQAFMWGMYLGLRSKLEDLEPERVEQQPGIVLVSRALERRKNYIKENFGAMRLDNAKPDGDAGKATTLGWLAGQETEIRKGVTAQRNEARLLA
jgi:hypothetical protein